MKEIIDFLEKKTLPQDEKRAREIVLSQSQFQIIEGVLYHIEKDRTLRIIPPQSLQEKLFHEAHDGTFGAHFRDAKIHSVLGKHYWWPGMRADIQKWCRACLTCATRRTGRALKPPLTPIPVAGPFDRVGVDVIKFPKSTSGNQYAVVFMDYLTKWPEVFAVRDQTALTIAKLLVEHVISRHGVPAELLSDRGAAFLSNLVNGICQLMGIHQVNTTAYHPQTDGLVERFNRTLTEMLAKKVERSGQDWDTHLPFVLFAYRSSLQESTRESPFVLLYGRDPRLPSEVVNPSVNRQEIDIDTYKGEVVANLSDAWDLARTHIKKAQDRQKSAHDQRARVPKYQVGERVFVYMPAAKSTRAYKFARPFHGPYRVITVYETGLEVRPVNQPEKKPIRIAFNRVRRCPEEIPNTFWPSKSRPPKEVDDDFSDQIAEKGVMRPREKTATATSASIDKSDQSSPTMNTWEGRLRSRTKGTDRARTPDAKDGDM